MLKFNAERFMGITSMLALVKTLVDTKIAVTGTSWNDPVPEDTKQYLRQGLPTLKEECHELGLRLSCLAISDLQRSVDTLTFSHLADKALNLQTRIEDELSLSILLQVSADRQAHYEGPDVFGENVTKQFPSVSYDVDEAAKCFALQRSTACVMHLMRIMEAAVDAIALGVGVPIPAVRAVNTWEQLLNLIRDRIVAHNKSGVPSWTASRQFYENALAYLHAVKDAWRNPSVHDLQTKYTDAEAERILNAIKHLMAHLAEHLDEQGQYRP